MWKIKKKKKKKKSQEKLDFKNRPICIWKSFIFQKLDFYGIFGVY